MKPVKSLVPLSRWLLRLAAASIIYAGYFNIAIGFSFSGLGYFIALCMVVLGVMLVIGGITKDSTLTVVSGGLILLFCIIQLLAVNGFSLNGLAGFLPLAAISFYFMAGGNGS